MRALAWRWMRWRVRHYVWAADLAYRRHPSPVNADAWARAAQLLERVEGRRP